LLDLGAVGAKYESIQKIDSKEEVMALMTGFPLVGYLMERRLAGRFSHLPPTVAAELEAFAADQAAAAASRTASVPAKAIGDGRMPSPMQDRCPPPRRAA
jgi:hypothetical protein